MSDLIYGLTILVPGVGLGAALVYLTAGKPAVSLGTRLWRLPRCRLARRR
ncbi:hypothetical protein ACIQCF_07310 [Streptomyces sp. NPDC088353]